MIIDMQSVGSAMEVLFSRGWIAIGVLIVGILLLLKWKSQKFKRLPPVKSGPIPWLGCALQFGKAPLHVIRSAHQEMGDVYTIHAAGKCMTFVANPEDFQKDFFQNKNVDFQEAVQPYTKRAAGVSQKSFYEHHTTIHDTIRLHFVPAALTEMCPRLAKRFGTTLQEYSEEGTADLLDLVREAMFTSVVKEIYGEHRVPTTKAGMKEMLKAFIKFDQDFEYGAELPEIFVKDWADCKYWLIDLFKDCVSMVRGKQSPTLSGQDTPKPTLFEELIKVCNSPSAPNYALLLLWASQANAVPAVFWTVAYILNDSKIRQSVTQEISNNLKENNMKTFDYSAVTEQWLQGCPLVKRCVLEAIRLRAPGMITRKVTKTHTIKGFDIPEGHYLMLSPYWAHRNERNFPDPEAYDPDRWLACDVEKYQFIQGFVGFGGGRYQCPGRFDVMTIRWFALMEMHLFVTIVMATFEFELLEEVPKPSPLHIIGNQQPLGSCLVKYKKTV